MAGVSAKELASAYPEVFHMAEYDAWPSIQRNGLLSTTALLDLFGIIGEERHAIESCRRPQKVSITSAVHGTAIIRDQKPMRPSALRRCLSDVSESQWYGLLNRRVFFWLQEKRLHTLLSARAYRSETHCVLTFATESLLSAYEDRITLSALNTGSTLYNPPTRGSGTFCPLAVYPFVERRKKAGSRNAVVELAVDYAVPNAAALCKRVAIMSGATVVKTLFER